MWDHCQSGINVGRWRHGQWSSSLPARSLKFRPLSLRMAMKKGLGFNIADSFAIPTAKGTKDGLKDFTTWELPSDRPGYSHRPLFSVGSLLCRGSFLYQAVTGVGPLVLSAPELMIGLTRESTTFRSTWKTALRGGSSSSSTTQLVKLCEKVRQTMFSPAPTESTDFCLARRRFPCCVYCARSVCF